MSFALAIKDRKSFVTWTVFTIFCILFSTIYEFFSFGVFSIYMIALGVWPLFLGILPSLFFKEHMGRFWTDGILMITLGSMLQGILEIYGTSSIYPIIMMAAGVAFLMLAGVLHLFE